MGLYSDLCLPAVLNERMRRLCEIVRDADKVDIVCVLGASNVRDILGSTPERFEYGEISDEAMVAFRVRRCLGPGDWKADLGWLVRRGHLRGFWSGRSG